MVPPGKEIYRTSAFQQQGYSKLIDKRLPNSDQIVTVYERRNGVCAALTALWIRKTLEHGDPTQFNHLNDHMYIGISQAAYIFGSFAPRDSSRYNSVQQEKTLLESNNLQVTSPQIDVYSRKSLTSFLTQMVSNFGCYFFAMEDEKGYGHVIGFMTGSTGFYLFDANEGLYQSANRNTFINKNVFYLASDYSNYEGGPIHCYHCQLEGR